jgi:RNA polymerase-binding transcription factor DksA
MLQVEERVKSKVARELGRVNRFIATLKGEARPEEMESAGDNTPFSEVADATQVLEEREVRSQLLDYLVERAIDLERALRRIDEGTYGVCVRCDGFIHPERLRALPEATLCLECQKTAESERRAAEPTPFEWLEAASRERESAEGD